MLNASLISRFYDTHCRTRFLLPTDGDVSLLESRLGVALPTIYREFLLRFNGGLFADPLFVARGNVDRFRIAYLHGIYAPVKHADLGSDTDIFDDNDPVEILPIGATNGGDLLLMSTFEDEDYGCISLRAIDQATHFIVDGFDELFDLLM